MQLQVQISGVFEYCCMKTSHIIIVNKGVCEIIHIHDSDYFNFIIIFKYAGAEWFSHKALQ